jgi:Tfp pilus assembly protein PilF
MAHFALGSLLWTDGKIEDSNWHLRQSFKIDPKMPLVCNNMAWMIAHSESGQLDEAMDLVKQALLVQPDRAEFRDTLGVILMKQEKYDEAIAEFEAILSNPALKKSIHRNLAICYQKIGKSSLAKAHAEKAE